jgi:hypothetical protein
MRMTDSTDELMGLLHDLALLSAEDLERTFSCEQLQQRVIDVTHTNIPTVVEPHCQLSYAELYEWIQDLRRSERDWARALGDAILKANELADSGDRSGAYASLRKFAASCPWQPLCSIAETESQLYLKTS